LGVGEAWVECARSEQARDRNKPPPAVVEILHGRAVGEGHADNVARLVVPITNGVPRALDVPPLGRLPAPRVVLGPGLAYRLAAGSKEPRLGHSTVLVVVERRVRSIRVCRALEPAKLVISVRGAVRLDRPAAGVVHVLMHRLRVARQVDFKRFIPVSMDRSAWRLGRITVERLPARSVDHSGDPSEQIVLEPGHDRKPVLRLLLDAHLPSCGVEIGSGVSAKGVSERLYRYCP